MNSRVLVLLAVIGSFVLALLAVLDPLPLRLAVNLAFDLCVLVPLVILYGLRA